MPIQRLGEIRSILVIREYVVFDVRFGRSESIFKNAEFSAIVVSNTFVTCVIESLDRASELTSRSPELGIFSLLLGCIRWLV